MLSAVVAGVLPAVVGVFLPDSWKVPYWALCLGFALGNMFQILVRDGWR